MRIDHISIYVEDLEAERDFFIKYFGASAGSRYSNFRTDSTNYFIKFDDGARLEIMKRETSIDVHNKPQRTGYNHIAISVGDRKDVDDMVKRMEADGVQIFSGARTTGDGYYSAVIVDPEGNGIEIIAEDTKDIRG